jgi:antitoxin HicB
MPSLTEGTAASYRISLVRTGDGQEASWLAEVDDLPECSARGATPEEAMQRAWRAVQDSLDGRTTEARPEPAPRHSGKLLVRMPATLHDELARAAEAEGVSLNQLITGVLASAVEWRSTEGSPRTASSSSEPPAPGEKRITRLVLAANLAVVSIAAILAIVLLVVAWRAGVS